MGSISDDTRKTKVVVVGAGFAGMAACIECQRRGMQAVLVEKYNDSSAYGDIIDFFANAGRVIATWDNGKVADKLLEICITKAKYMQMRKHTGELVHNDPWYPDPSHARIQYAGQRGAMWKIFRDYATDIGVQMLFGSGVIDYSETDDSAQVRLSDGTEIVADCVLAGDGPKSLAREKVLGLEDHRTSSGFAIYRSYFEVTDEFRKDSLLQDYLNKDEDMIKIWIGPNSHMLAYSWNHGTQIAWVLTHPDDQDIGESWSEAADPNDALQYIREYHPECSALVKQTPRNQIIDYKLVWRDPLETWLSKKHRIAVIGDAAHCHLPTSGQGGSQAIEDGVVAAVCLEQAKGDAPLALQVMERIRFNRSHVIHQSGSQIRETWHENPWEQIKGEPEKIAMARGNWILDFDPVENALEHFDHLAQDVRSGKEGTLSELSLPAGGSYEEIRG